MKFNPVIFYSLIVSLGGFIFGYDASVVSGALGQVTKAFSLSPIQQGLVVGAPTFGAIISTLIAGQLADSFGRRKTLMAIALLYLVSAIVSAFAPNYEALVLARFVGGLAFCSLMIAPMYIAEISPAHIRGKLVSFNQLNIVIGFSAAYFTNYFVSQLGKSDAGWIQTLYLDSQGWRWMFGLEIAPALVYFLMLFVIPRSPRWLVMHGKAQEACRVLKRLRPECDETQIQTSVKDIQATSDVKHPGLADRLKEIVSPTLRKALLIGLLVGIAQQATGVNAVYFYAPSIFEQSGVGSDAALAQAIWIGLTNVIFTVLAMSIIDKLGRKPMLILGLTGVLISMSVCAYGYMNATYQLTQQDMVTLAAVVDSQALAGLTDVFYDNDVAFKKAVIAAIGETAFQANQGTIIQAAATLNAPLILFGILGFVASFAFSLGPVMWVLFSEIFPNHIRGLAISVVGVVNSIVSFIVQVLFPWELANLGNALTFAIYALFAIIGLVLVIRFLPETKGKTLEQLEQELTSNHATRNSA